MFYGAVLWDPWLIVGQIICLQCLYYLTLGLFLSILVGLHVSRVSLVYFFDYSTLSASTATGWCSIASFLLSSIAGYLIAGRSLSEFLSPPSSFRERPIILCDRNDHP